MERHDLVIYSIHKVNLLSNYSFKVDLKLYRGSTIDISKVILSDAKAVQLLWRGRAVLLAGRPTLDIPSGVHYSETIGTATPDVSDEPLAVLVAHL